MTKKIKHLIICGGSLSGGGNLGILKKRQFLLKNLLKINGI
jgi:hypothetical protein